MDSPAVTPWFFKPDAVGVVKWSVWLLGAGVLAWRIILLGIAAHEAARENAGATALAWYARHPQALFEQARSLFDTDPAQAERLLGQAIQANPADGRLYIALAQLWERRGEVQKATSLVTIASRLAPMRSAVQLQVGAFWLRQGRLDEALTHLSTALRLRADLRADLYPVLLEFAEDARTRPVFLPLLKEPPDWWEDFFHYAATNAALDTVKALYHEQRRQGSPLSSTQEHDYLARLQREERWTELYFAWLNGLDSQQIKVFGHLYNGGFEQPFTQQGFDWQVSKVPGVSVAAEPTYGMTGARALKVTFQGQRAQFRHFYQYLLLSAGHYRLQGRARPEGLQAERGVRWEVVCVGDGNALLAASEPFLGADQWRPFTAEFAVPAQACPVQVLRLILIGRAALDFEAKGTVWFDDMLIERIERID